MQEDDLLPISIPALAENPHIPDSYPTSSIPRRSPSLILTPTSTVILDDIREPVFSNLNTMEVEVVDFVGSTYDLDSGDSK